MKYLIHIDEIGKVHKADVGDKAYNLALLKKSGAKIPETVTLTTAAYEKFLLSSRLNIFIDRELNRKKISDCRWEELWDISLRIKNTFIRCKMPSDIENSIAGHIQEYLSGRPLAVRSSAPGEDGRNSSFAGLHESYINLSEIEEIIKHIQLVWASLWSVSALLYRRELKLAPEKSAMAVVIQELIHGEVSGVAFSSSPDAPDHIAVEAVYGLNQGLVDGSVEPDHWNVIRNNLKIHSFFPAGERDSAIVPAAGKTLLQKLSPTQKSSPPLLSEQVIRVADEAMRQEKFFGHPRDIEWTFKGSDLFILQSRPITTIDEPKDSRKYYDGLQLSFEQLRKIRTQLEDKILPDMLTVAQTWNRQKVETMTERQLLDCAGERLEKYRRGLQDYEKYCIPFAHGTRLFGEIYNAEIKPEDPYEFVELLRTGELISLQRNRKLIELARKINKNSPLSTEDSELIAKSFDIKTTSKIPEKIIKTLKALAEYTGSRKSQNKRQQLETSFFAAFDKNRQEYARELLKVARSSYRLRDDDNLYLAGLKNGLDRVRDECRKRLDSGLFNATAKAEAESIIKARIPELHSPAISNGDSTFNDANIKFRQLTGQPAGKGVARGPARVINKFNELLDFKKGEILVCDAVEPEMTVIAPLAAAVVERRGGMLIHGAIIAREYSLPCVTGVADATRKIKTGNVIAVDGWLGIVTILKH